MALEPQDALEVATLELLLASAGATGAGFDDKHCKRMFDGRPPPICPQWFVSVWSDERVEVGRNRAADTALDETYSVYVTLTVQLSLPFDRWAEHRVFLAGKANLVRAVIHRDVYNNIIVNAANTLAGFRRADLGDGATAPVGFLRGLTFDGKDPITEVGPDHFNGEPFHHANQYSSGTGGAPRVGIAQRLRFGGVSRIQNLANMG